MLRFTNDKTSTQNGLSYSAPSQIRLCNGSDWATGKSIVAVIESYSDFSNNNTYVDHLWGEFSATPHYGVAIYRYPYSDRIDTVFRNAAGTVYTHQATTVAKHRGWYRHVVKITFGAGPSVTVKTWDRSGLLTTSAGGLAGTPPTGATWRLGANVTGGVTWGLNGAINRLWIIDNTADAVTDAQCLAMAAVPTSLAEETTKGRGLIATIVAANNHWTNTDTTEDAVLTISGTPTAQAATAIGTATSVVVRRPVIDAPSTMPNATWDMALALRPESIAGDNGADGSTAAFTWGCALSLGATLATGGAGVPRPGDVFGRGGVFEVDRDVGTAANGYRNITAGGPILSSQGAILLAMRAHGFFHTSGVKNLFQIGSANSLKVGLTSDHQFSVNATTMDDGTTTTALVPSTPFFAGLYCDGTDTYANIEGQTVKATGVVWTAGTSGRADDFMWIGADAASAASPSSTIYSMHVFTNAKYAACVAALRTLIMEQHGFRTGDPSTLGVLYGTSRIAGFYSYQGNGPPAQCFESYYAGCEIHNYGVPGVTLATLAANFAALCNQTALINRVASRSYRWIVLQGGDNEKASESPTVAWDTTNPGAADVDWIAAAASALTEYNTVLTAASTNYATRIRCTVVPRGDLIDAANQSRNWHGCCYYFNSSVKTNAAGAEAVADIAGQLPFNRAWDTALASITRTTTQAAINPSGPDYYNSFDTYLHLIGQQGDGQALFGKPIRGALADAGAPGFAALAPAINKIIPIPVPM